MKTLPTYSHHQSTELLSAMKTKIWVHDFGFSENLQCGWMAELTSLLDEVKLSWLDVVTAAAERLLELQQVQVYWMNFKLSPQLGDLPIQPPVQVRLLQSRYFKQERKFSFGKSGKDSHKHKSREKTKMSKWKFEFDLKISSTVSGPHLACESCSLNPHNLQLQYVWLVSNCCWVSHSLFITHSTFLRSWPKIPISSSHGLAELQPQHLISLLLSVALKRKKQNMHTLLKLTAVLWISTHWQKLNK